VFRCIASPLSYSAGLACSRSAVAVGRNHSPSKLYVLSDERFDGQFCDLDVAAGTSLLQSIYFYRSNLMQNACRNIPHL
jgi:hypothetical protein